MPVYPTEYQEGVALANYFEILKQSGKVIKYAHLVNELKLDRRKGQLPNFAYLNSRKAEGWKPGVPDYLVITKSAVLFIELKRKGKHAVSPEQKTWIEALNGVAGNVSAKVCIGAEEAIAFVKEHIT